MSHLVRTVRQTPVKFVQKKLPLFFSVNLVIYKELQKYHQGLNPMFLGLFKNRNTWFGTCALAARQVNILPPQRRRAAMTLLLFKRQCRKWVNPYLLFFKLTSY